MLQHQQHAVPVACRELGQDHIFGVPSKHEAGSVSSLLKGDYSPEQLQDDADLGKSVKEGWRNLGPAGRVKHTLSHGYVAATGVQDALSKPSVATYHMTRPRQHDKALVWMLNTTPDTVRNSTETFHMKGSSPWVIEAVKLCIHEALYRNIIQCGWVHLAKCRLQAISAQPSTMPAATPLSCSLKLNLFTPLWAHTICPTMQVPCLSSTSTRYVSADLRRAYSQA